MKFETDPNLDTSSETFTLNPSTKNEFVWINTTMFTLVELEYADLCECMNTEGFLLNEKVCLALKTAAKTKSLINKVSKYLLSNFDIDGEKEDFAHIMKGIFETIKKCYLIAAESEIIILVSSKKIEDLDEVKNESCDDCCVCCGGTCDDAEPSVVVDPKTLN